MGSRMAQQLADVPLRNVKARLRRGEPSLQKLNSEAGEVLNLARAAAQIEAKELALTVGLSHSLALRALAGKPTGDIGFRRLWLLPDAFWIELVLLVAQRRGIAAVKRQIIVDMEKAG